MTRLLVAVALLGPVTGLDATVREALQGARTPAGSAFMQAVSNAGKPVTVLGALVVIAVADRAAGPLTAARALLALAPTNAVVEVLKRGVNRVRPDGERKSSNASFPSSHAANGFALAAVLSRRWRRLAIPFHLLALLVALSRLYLDRHWLSDVVVGAGIGLVCAWGVACWTRRWGGAIRPSVEAAGGS